MEEDEEIVWPAVGQELFVADPEPAWLLVSGDGWYDYREGFLAGAQALLARAEADYFDAQLMVFPIVFLYRHYLELAMKDFIRDGIRLVSSAADVKATHRLSELWGACREIIEKWKPGQQLEELDAIHDQMRQFDTVDPQSMSFRYPVNKKGARSLPENLGSFNLKNFAERVEAIGLWLDGAGVGMHEEASFRAEMAEEARLEQAYYDDE